MTRYDGYHVVRAWPASQQDVDALGTLGAQLLGGSSGTGAVDYIVPPEAVPALGGLGVPHEVLDKDIQTAIDAQQSRLAAAASADARAASWFDDYKPLADIEAKLQAMAGDRHDLCTLVDIGDSVEGRDIWALRISGPGSGKPAVLLNGTQHAREWISPMVNMYVADRLVYGYDSDPQIQSLLNQAEIFVAPVVNPDGYVYTWTNDRLWRKNRRDNAASDSFGVDLNRNWDANWGGPGSSGDPSDATYRGTAPFSEPETAALSDFFLANPQIVSNIDYHNYGQYILSPYGYTYELPADHELLMDIGTGMQAEIAAVHGEVYEMGPAADALYQLSGASIDWAYDAQGVLAYTIELRPDGWPYFLLPAAEIVPTCEENLPAALYLIDRSIAIPEPCTLLLLGTAVLGLLLGVWRRRKS